jgi:hypothetical protein
MVCVARPKVVKVGFQKPNHHGERQHPAPDKTRQIPRAGQTATRAHLALLTWTLLKLPPC